MAPRLSSCGIPVLAQRTGITVRFTMYLPPVCHGTETEKGPFHRCVHPPGLPAFLVALPVRYRNTFHCGRNRFNKGFKVLATQHIQAAKSPGRNSKAVVPVNIFRLWNDAAYGQAHQLILTQPCMRPDDGYSPPHRG